MSGMIYSAAKFEDGSVAVPDEMRHRWGVVDGEPLRMAVIDGELRVKTLRSVFEGIAREIREVVPEGVSLADELIADRRAEAARE